MPYNENGVWTWDEKEFAPNPLTNEEAKLLTGMDLDLEKPEDQARLKAYAEKSGKALERLEKFEWGAAILGLTFIVGLWISLYAWVFSMAG